MKLYFTPGACSLSPHVALREAGIPFELVKVDLRSKRTADGRDFSTINPFGYVPALELDSGEILTEGPAIVQYIADLAPEKALAPVNGTMARYRLQSWLAFINSEVHKTLGALFNPTLTEDVRAATLQKFRTRLDQLETQFGDQPYLLGDAFSVADTYLYNVLGWTRLFKLELTPWPRIAAHFARIGARPAVQAAQAAEAA
jgi:glutathione S-transferase